MTEDFLIRARLDRLGLAELITPVLDSGMTWPDARTFACFAWCAIADARDGLDPSATIDRLARDPSMPASVVAALRRLAAQAAPIVH